MVRSGRGYAWALTGVSVLAFGGALAVMTLRVRDFNVGHHLKRWHAEPIQTRAFAFEGFPNATLNDGPDQRVPVGQGGLGGGAWSTVELDYAGKKTLIPVKRPPVKNMPNLALYDEWLAVLAISEVGLDKPEPGPEAHSVGIADSGQLLIVVRKTPEGYDPESWGSVRRIEWVFDYYRLLKDGQIETFERRWPRSNRAEKRLQQLAAADPAATPSDLTSPAEIADWRAEVSRSKLLAAIPTLDQRGPEYFAALHVIPKLNVPKYKFNDTAFDIKILGWTLPTAMLAVLVGSVSFVFAIAPRRRVRAISVG